MIPMILSALLVGISTGWVLQRGRTCMNSAFRDIIFINDFTLFKAYILALSILIVGANLLEEFIYIEELRRQGFAPLANILGGYIFGLGIVLAGGCGSGIWYRVGEGMFSSWVTVLGFVLGLNLTRNGLLSPVNEVLHKFQVWHTEDGIRTFTPDQLLDYSGEMFPLTLDNLIGLNKWIVIAVIVAVALPLIFRGGIEKARLGYAWHQTGLILGLVGIAAWWASEVWGGGARGISYAGPTTELFRFIQYGGEPTWSAILVIGTPIGAYLSALSLKEFKLKAPGAEELLRVFIGGVVMGIGAVIGGGCNIGHGLTGVSTLAISSIIATIFIILGNWTMVYVLFIKPLQD